MANRRIAAETALYLYGISKSSRAKAASIASEGIDGVHPVQSLACEDFICWVSSVDAASFSRAISSNMENLEWLALHGVRHQKIVAEIAARNTVVPARFGTIFSSEATLFKNVRARRTALEKVFAKISDAEEWGVKVFAEQARAPQPAERVRSGKDYLQLKAARLKKRPERDNSGLQELTAELEKIAIDSAPTGKVSGTQQDLLWQATFLVPRSRHGQWNQALKEFVKKWRGKRRIEVNGPWPPYSFVADAE